MLIEFMKEGESLNKVIAFLKVLLHVKIIKSTEDSQLICLKAKLRTNKTNKTSFNTKR